MGRLARRAYRYRCRYRYRYRYRYQSAQFSLDSILRTDSSLS